MVFRSLPVMTLTFDLLTPKSKQHICEPTYNCHQNWVKFPSLVFEIWCSQYFRVIAYCDLDLWPFEPKMCSAHLQTHIHPWPKLGEIPFIVFWAMVFTKLSGHRLTHSLTVCFRYHFSTAAEAQNWWAWQFWKLWESIKAVLSELVSFKCGMRETANDQWIAIVVRMIIAHMNYYTSIFFGSSWSVILQVGYSQYDARDAWAVSGHEPGCHHLALFHPWTWYPPMMRPADHHGSRWSLQTRRRNRSCWPASELSVLVPRHHRK